MEMHLVHADKEGNLAVVAVMLTEGGENSTLAKIWEQMPGTGRGEGGGAERENIGGRAAAPLCQDSCPFC